MNWERIVTSPPPNTGWVLGATDAVVVHRAAGDEIHCAAEDLPEGAFEVGAVGLQSVNTEAVGPAFARLKGAAEGARSAAVVLPTSWLRSFLIDVDRPPRKEDELRDVVRWRLKKLLPVAPTELRLSIVRLPEVDGQKKLLVMAGIERAVDAIEAAFKAIGVEVGLITTRLFAVVPRGAGIVRPSLVVQHEESFLSLLLLTDGVPRLLRTKPLALADQSSGTVLREIGLTMGFIRDSLGQTSEIEVKLSCENPVIDGEIRNWMAAQDGLTPLVENVMPPCGPTTVVDRLGAARLAPAVAVVRGELR
jgi:hypothetical protein